MAKAKRANHRSGTEKPRWAPDGTVDGSDPSDWEPTDGTDRQQPHALTGRAPAAYEVAANGRPDPGFGTSVRLDEIAVAAMALSDGLAVASRKLPESVESRRFRRELDDAASTFRAVAGELESTAGGLVRLAANEWQACAVSWGICPEHGISLMEVDEVATCRVLSCYHQPESPVERCELRVAYRVVDAGGPAMLACAGHAIACRLHLETAVITLASDSLELL